MAFWLPTDLIRGYSMHLPYRQQRLKFSPVRMSRHQTLETRLVRIILKVGNLQTKVESNVGG